MVCRREEGNIVRDPTNYLRSNFSCLFFFFSYHRFVLLDLLLRSRVRWCGWNDVRWRCTWGQEQWVFVWRWLFRCWAFMQVDGHCSCIFFLLASLRYLALSFCLPLFFSILIFLIIVLSARMLRRLRVWLNCLPLSMDMLL